MQLTIRHETHYAYSAPLAYTIQQLHLTPRKEPQQHVLSWNIAMPGHVHAYTDAYGNQNVYTYFHQYTNANPNAERANTDRHPATTAD